jgi:hypothetical protein
MKKLLLVGALAFGGFSCAPDIKQDPSNADAYVIAQFDPTGSPAVVPSPNDLAINPATGLVNAPIDPTSSEAQQEFTRDYINTLNGFPTTVVATTKIADLDPSTLNTATHPNTVRFIDLLKGTPIATPPVEADISYDEETDTVSIKPKAPATSWPKGGRYAVALIGGDNGLRGNGGKPVIGSAVWAFASSVNPLVTCEDLTAPNCLTATEIIPSAETDPAARLADQTASALRLEQLRRSYRPVLDALVEQDKAQGGELKREDIVLMWTFRIMNQPEVTFDPAASIIPFPNDLLRNPATGRLNLPIPPGASPTQQQLIGGLNTLDGFSTTAATVSENSDSRGAIEAGSRLDAARVVTGTAFVKLTSAPGVVGTEPKVTACINCVSSSGSTSASNPQQLQFVPQVPLDEKSTYAAIMLASQKKEKKDEQGNVIGYEDTPGLYDERGRKLATNGVFALMRMASPLVKDGKSQVSGVSDANANALEPLRAGFKPMFDGLEAKGLKRRDIALAWSYTTQSTVSTLAQLHAIPSIPALSLPEAPLYLFEVTGSIKGAMSARGLPTANLGKIFEGQMVLPFALTGTGGTLNPNPAQFRFERVQFLLALPAAQAPTDGYPVTIFSHGLTSNRNTALPIINALAGAGHATVSLDTVFHGERSSCVGITAQSGLGSIDSPDKACAAATQRCETSTTSPSYGRCVSDTRNACNPSSPATGDYACAAAGQGRCIGTSVTDQTLGMCEGGSFALNPSTNAPAISGWNLLNLGNLFATRDNFRQHTIDHAQLARVLSSAGIDTQLTAQGGGTLDGNKIHYVGQSLGAILGPLYTSVSPNVKKAVFNVPGSNLTGMLLTSPAFAAQRTGFLAALSAQGISPGTPAFDQFLGLAKTILDPADPLNYIYHVEHGAAAPQGTDRREAFIQYIDQDQVAPNALTEELIRAANDRASTKKVATHPFMPSLGELSLEKRHSFLLDFSGNPVITTQAQTQAIQFLNTGSLP